MALVPAESKIPALMVAHLVARRTDADNPTPSSANVTLLAGPVKSTTARTQPSVEVWVSGITFAGLRNCQVVEIHMDYHAHPDTAQDTELGYVSAFRRSFAGGPSAGNANSSDANTNPFLAYCNGLSTGNKTGWSIDNIYIKSCQTIIDDQNRVVYRTTLEAQFRSSVFTV